MKWKDSNNDVETAAEEEETFEEDYSPLRTRKLNFGSRLASIFARPGSWLVIIPIALLMLLIFFMRSGGSDRTLLSAMDQRFQQLESRMSTLEGIGNLVTDIDKKQKATQSLLVRLDRLEASFAKRISEMEKQVKKLQTKIGNTGNKQNQTPVTKSSLSTQAAKTHLVKKGETLYSISKQYGLSVTRLMALNKLSKGAVINPGQSLKVKP
jgi:LysM repeat protein